MNSKTIKVPVALSDLEEHFKDQLDFLDRTCNHFDAGNENEYRRLALTIRLLLHTNRHSTSLVEQVGLENTLFLSFAMRSNPRNSATEFPLAMVRMTDHDATLLPLLDNGPMGSNLLDLKAWWEEPIFRDDQHEIFSRRDFVLFVSDQDGGAHVDPALDKKYYRLKEENSIGLIYSGPNGEKPLKRLESAYLRHIAFEVLQSLKPSWSRKMGNRICDCGSGRKARYCCLKYVKS